MSYKLLVKLGTTLEAGFSGIVELKFTLKNNKDSVNIDFQGQSISDVRVNGKNVKPEFVKFESHQIVFQQSLFKNSGENTI